MARSVQAPTAHCREAEEIMMGQAVHRTILVVDMADYGDPARTGANQLTMRAGLYRTMEYAFDRAHIPWDACYREDRGDGLFVLAPADIPKALFIEALPPALTMGLGEYNREHPPREQIRLRLALHAGEVCYDDHGVASAAITLAFRLVDARPCRVALAGSPGGLAIITSNWFFEEVVRNSEAGARSYRRVRVKVKKTKTVGWVCAPHASVPAPRLPRHAMIEPVP